MQSHSLCGIRPLLEIAEGGRRDDQGRFLQRTWLPSPCRSNETPRFPAFSRLSSSTSLIHELVKGWRDNDTPGPLRPRRVGHGWGGACYGYRPWQRCAPEEYSEGMKPTHIISARGLSQRVRSRMSATRMTATVHCTSAYGSRQGIRNRFSRPHASWL